ncbi:MAG: hypothetical protein KDB60_18570, partial [Propionibacteriaceae bacterium]|nr:hypothetical protein [Propionibacteriaceae bacterium]
MSLPTLPTAPPSPMGKGTLSRQLVLRTTALVALVTVALSVLTALASFQILQNQLDDRIQSAIERPSRTPHNGTDDQTSPGDPGGSGLIRIDAALTRNSAGAVAVVQSGYITRPDDVSEATVVSLLVALSEQTDGSPVTTPVAGGGLYRIQVQQRDLNGTTITTLVGLPYSEVTTPMTSQLIMAGLLTIGAVILSYVAARRVVETSLRPLTRLAATANQVSNLPLESGDGHVP